MGRPLFGDFGVLVDDGDRVQCHVCGDWYANLGSHTSHAHGITADTYRQAFGLMQATKLIGPAFRRRRQVLAAEQLRAMETPGRARLLNLTTEQCRRAMANVVRRREHDLHRTEPERMRAAHEAVWGDPRGYPDEYLDEIADLFLQELQNGQRGVYRRMGERTGVGWSRIRCRPGRDAPASPPDGIGLSAVRSAA